MKAKKKKLKEKGTAQVNHPLTYRQPIISSEGQIISVAIEVIRITDFYRQDVVTVKISGIQFQSTVGQLEALSICLNRYLDDPLVRRPCMLHPEAEVIKKDIDRLKQRQKNRI